MVDEVRVVQAGVLEDALLVRHLAPRAPLAAAAHHTATGLGVPGQDGRVAPVGGELSPMLAAQHGTLTAQALSVMSSRCSFTHRHPAGGAAMAPEGTTTHRAR